MNEEANFEEPIVKLRRRIEELSALPDDASHRREIEKLEKETTQKGMTLIVTSIYWKNGRIKFEIGVAKGKKLYDKRETEARKTQEREARAAMKERR